MADVVLQVTIKDAHTMRVLTAITEQAGKSVRMQIQDNDYFSWGEDPWSYNPKATGETNKQFAERMLRRFLIAFVKHYEYNLDVVRQRSEINAIDPPSENVPDGIVE